MKAARWLPYGCSTGLGLALWTAAAFYGHHKEPWDTPQYWSITYPAAVMLCGFLGFLFPARPWRWAAILMFMQFPGMMLNGDGYNLLPLGVILIAVLALPGAGLSYLCAAARH